MTLEQKLILAALIRGLPYGIIVVSAGIYAAKRKNVLSGLLAVGFLGVAAKDIWSIFAPIWMRSYSIEQYSNISLRLSICSVIGLYIVSITIDAMLITKGKTDNR